MSTVKELQAQMEEIQKKLEAARKQEVSSAIAQIRALMTDHGLTVEDLGGRATRATNKSAGAKVPAKYRHPSTGETWSGRGIKPKWLQNEINGGKALEDFAV